MKLLAFLPCEKIIISTLGNPSIISVLSKVEVQIPANQIIPPEAVTPKEWQIFTLWHLSPQEQGRQFDQKVEIDFPNGQRFGQTSIIHFPDPIVSGQVQAMNMVNLLGLPVGRVGNLLIRLWVEDNGKRITDEYEHRVEIVHQSTQAPIPAPQPTS